MAADRIEREIIVEAAQERVWAVLTEAGHVAKWFGDSARVDLTPGGQAAFGWTEYGGTHYAVIERVEPPGFFSYRWARRRASRSRRATPPWWSSRSRRRARAARGCG